MNDIDLIRVSKSFSGAGGKVVALDNVDLSVKPHESVAIVGPSGSGKTTLLKIMGLLYSPDEGRVIIDGTDSSKLTGKEKNSFRVMHFGYIHQDLAIIDEDTVYDNIVLPLRYTGIRRKEWRKRVGDASELLGIGELLKKKAGKLSGGEKQRAAIARAIVCEQRIILADEPTGALDRENKEKVADALLSLNKDLGKTLVIVTHDELLASKCSRVVRIAGGRIESD